MIGESLAEIKPPIGVDHESRITIAWGSPGLPPSTVAGSGAPANAASQAVPFTPAYVLYQTSAGGGVFVGRLRGQKSVRWKDYFATRFAPPV